MRSNSLATKNRRNLIDDIPGMRTSRGVKRMLNISWWKVVTGAVLVLIGLVAGASYLSDYTNMIAGGATVFGLGPGTILIWWGLSKFSQSFMFNTATARIATGKENAVRILATRNGGNKDRPFLIDFVELKKPPRGARLHYFRNYRRHFYEIMNDTAARNKIKELLLPDKKPYPPELYKTAAIMQAVKDYEEYSPMTALQKWSPVIIVVTMGVVGLLMTITLG